MVRLRNRDVQPSAKYSKTEKSDEAFNPLHLYQRYIHSVQMNPKLKDAPQNCAIKSGPLTGRRHNIQKQSMPLKQPSSAMEMKRSKVSRVQSKPSVDLMTSRAKNRPKTATLKNKPVERLADYELPVDKKVTFQADEIECFFDALKETVEEVVQSKLSTMVHAVVDTLTRKIDEVSNKSQALEGALANVCNELNSKISYYGEEHNRHFRYICMKLEYDKIFYQHMNNLIHAEARIPESRQQSNQQLPQQQSQQSYQTFTSASQQATSVIQNPDTCNDIPTSSHTPYNQRACDPAPQQLSPGWPYQAGDSILNSNLVQISQTARQFSHSPSGPFHRVMACQTSRSCPKQIDVDAESSSDYPEDPMLVKRASHSKSADVAPETCQKDKVQLGIKEFIDTLRIFQSNLNSRDTLINADSETPEEVKQLKRNSVLSPMDTDNSSSDGDVSNAVSIISSKEDLTLCVENASSFISGTTAK